MILSPNSLTMFHLTSFASLFYHLLAKPQRLTHRLLLRLHTILIHLCLYTTFTGPTSHALAWPLIFTLFCHLLTSLAIEVLRDNLIAKLVSNNQKLQQDLEQKDTYNASIIHELRNPLNAVLGSISLLKLSKALTTPED